MNEDDLSFFGEVPSQERTPRRRQRERILEIEGQIDDSPTVDPQVGTITGGFFQEHQDPVDISNTHPLEGFMELVRSFEQIIQRARTENTQQPDPEWLKTETGALREIRMTLQNLLPHWNEYQARQREEEDNWVDEQMRFTANHIRVNYGEDAMVEYLEAWQKWIDEYGLVLPTEGA